MSAPGSDEPLKGTYWFPLRRYLPGWGLPVCWQGWLVLVGYFALLAAPLPYLGKAAAGYYIGYAAFLTCILFWIVSRKGESLR